jgi:sulfide:quinone oxidoreductase
MSEAKTVVILGGGVGGLVAATTLRKTLSEPHRVVLVDRERDHLFAPSLLWLMTGQRSARQITRPLDRLMRRGIEVIHGEIESIDAGSRRIRIGRPLADGGSQDLECDYLVVSLGAELAPGTIPGLAEAGHNLYTLAGAESLWIALHGFSGGRVVVLTAAPAYKCPAAPYEAAMLIIDHIRRRKLADQSRVDLYAAESGPLGVAGPEVSAGVRTMVEAKGVAYHPEHQVVEVVPSDQQLSFANGVTTRFDLLAFVPPHRASSRPRRGTDRRHRMDPH